MVVLIGNLFTEMVYLAEFNAVPLVTKFTGTPTWNLINYTKVEINRVDKDTTDQSCNEFELVMILDCNCYTNNCDGRGGPIMYITYSITWLQSKKRSCNGEGSKLRRCFKQRLTYIELTKH